MSHIEGRLKKAEQAARKSYPSEEDQMMCFVRMEPGVPSEAEIKWCQEHPNFKGKIYVVTFGKRDH